MELGKLIGNAQAELALILTLIRREGASLLLAGTSGVGKSHLLHLATKLLGPEEVYRLPSSTTLEKFDPQPEIHHILSEKKVYYSEGLTQTIRHKVLLLDNVNLYAPDLLHRILAEQEYCTIIATMNPSEGGLDSGILDKFDVMVQLQSITNPADRIELLKEHLTPTVNKEGYRELARLLQQLHGSTQQIIISNEIFHAAASIAQAHAVMGHRGDLALMQTAIAHAAWMGKRQVEQSDLNIAAELTLLHRKVNALPEQANPENKRDPQQEEQQEKDARGTADEEEKQSQTNHTTSPQEVETPKQSNEYPHSEDPNPSSSDADFSSPLFDFDAPAPQNMQHTIAEMTLAYDPLKEPYYATSRRQGGLGSRAKSKLGEQRGAYRRSTNHGQSLRDIALLPTLRAAIPLQTIRQKNLTSLPSHRLSSSIDFIIHPEDYRYKQYLHRVGYHILFVVDASGSMGVRDRMQLVKGLVLKLLQNSYIYRDKVAMITFRDEEATTILPFTKSILHADSCLREITTGGRTPLYLGLKKAYSELTALRRREKRVAPIVVLLTDGRATSTAKGENSTENITTAALQLQKQAERMIVIDTEESFLRLQKAKKLAEVIGAEYHTLEQLREKSQKDAYHDRAHSSAIGIDKLRDKRRI